MKKLILSDRAIEDMENMQEGQEFLNILQEKIEDGSFFEDSEAVDMEALETEDPELFYILMEALNSIEDRELN
jgi:hypothetical protein